MGQTALCWIFAFTVLGTAIALRDFQQERIISAVIRDATRPGKGLGTFIVNNCGHPDTDIFNLTGLTISPDPVSLPGTITIGANFTFRETGQSPFTLALDMYEKAGDTWINIPCIADIGSCTYDDFCDILALIDNCPQELVDAGIPCKCPYAAGSYSFPLTSFDVSEAIFPNGDYYVKAVYTSGSEAGGCVEIYISFYY